jgi:hypothetical protein
VREARDAGSGRSPGGSPSPAAMPRTVVHSTLVRCLPFVQMDGAMPESGGTRRPGCVESRTAEEEAAAIAAAGWERDAPGVGAEGGSTGTRLLIELRANRSGRIISWVGSSLLPTQTSPESLNTLPPRQIADVASNLM